MKRLQALLEDEYTEQTFHVRLGSSDKLIMLVCRIHHSSNHRSRDHLLSSIMGMTHSPIHSINQYITKTKVFRDVEKSRELILARSPKKPHPRGDTYCPSYGSRSLSRSRPSCGCGHGFTGPGRPFSGHGFEALADLYNRVKDPSLVMGTK